MKFDKKSLMRIIPLNDYSGIFSASAGYFSVEINKKLLIIPIPFKFTLTKFIFINKPLQAIRYYCGD